MQTIDFSYLPVRAGDFVLDLGCGEGRHVIAAACNLDINVFGVDLNKEDLLSARRKEKEVTIREGSAAKYIVGDALCLPFEDHCFDAVICSEVLEHVRDYQSVLKEIGRVLRNGGFFCASVPRHWPEKICWALSREYHEVPGGHVHIFRTGQLRQEIESLGMHSYRRHWAHALHVPFWWLKCIFWKSQKTNLLISLYHRMLVWDLMRQPLITRLLESLLNPLMGKSVVLYFQKDASL